MSWPSNGIYRDTSPAEYFALTEIDGKIVRSNSTLKAFDADPALFNSGYRKAPTKAMDRGSLFDCLLTSPHRFADDFVISPHDKFQSNAAKEWKAEQTKTIVTQSELEAAVSSIRAIQSDRRWLDIVEGDCGFQVAMRVDINDNPFKALVDILPDAEGPYGDALVDIKRLGQTESLTDVLKTCRKFAYNQQGGLYRGMARMLGERRNRFILFVVPATGPITPCVLDLSESMLATGAHAIMRMDARLTECEATGIWPGRFDGVKQIDQSIDGWEWKEIEDELDATSETP